MYVFIYCSIDIFQCRVVGQHHRVYSVNISVLPSSKAQDIESRFKCVCTCPAMCARCKHVAAALLSWKRSPQNWVIIHI